LAIKELAFASRQHTVSHFLFHQGIFGQKQRDPHPPSQFYLFPELKLKLKGHNFDTVEVIEAESQTVLNTLTEPDFQNASKKWQARWEHCIHMEGEYFEYDGDQ
jgi:hypothetical protein